MKNIIKLQVLFLLLFVSQAIAADQWTKAKPAAGDNLTAWPTDSQTNNSALDRLLANYRQQVTLTYATAATLTVSAGEVSCADSGATTKKWRQNTSSTTVTWSDIDTGAEASATTYYVYATCDVDAATFLVKISTSSSAPSGITYYRLLGSFYNNGSSNIEYVRSVNSTSLGEFSSRSFETTYQATVDGHVVGYTAATSQNHGMTVYQDAASSPATAIQNCYILWVSGGSGVSCPVSFPVRAGNYYKVTNSIGGGGTLYFIPHALNGGV